jgi:hypothetical protein
MMRMDTNRFTGLDDDSRRKLPIVPGCILQCRLPGG